MEEILLVAVCGVAAGVIAGLFGVGGGIVFVPALVIVVGLSAIEAEATSLLAIIPVALLGTWRQDRAGLVRRRDALVIGIVSIIPAILGALVADRLPDQALRLAFAALLLATAAQIAWRALRPRRAATDPAPPP